MLEDILQNPALHLHTPFAINLMGSEQSATHKPSKDTSDQDFSLS